MVPDFSPKGSDVLDAPGVKISVRLELEAILFVDVLQEGMHRGILR